MPEAIKLLDAESLRDPLFKNGQLEAIVGTATRLLIARQQRQAALILANADLSVRFLEHDNWNGGQDIWCLNLTVPIPTYCDLRDRGSTESEIDDAIQTPTGMLSNSDFIKCEIVPELVRDLDWRQKARQMIAGDGLTNQGRVHSENVAARQYDNLLFRSRPEIYFYRALKFAGVAFAPLSVIVGTNGVGQRSRRIEPDFVIFKDGLVTIVEIDSDLFHHETPHAAHLRLKFLLDEGPRLERINAEACDNDEKAREAVGRILLGIEKRRLART